MTSRERRVLRAAGLAQRATGAPLMVHPGRDPAAPDEILAVLDDVGADLERTTICHLERTVAGAEQLVDLGRRGAWLSSIASGWRRRSIRSTRGGDAKRRRRLRLSKPRSPPASAGGCCSPRMSARSTARLRSVARLRPPAARRSMPWPAGSRRRSPTRWSRPIRAVPGLAGAD
jgi:hypothetical protein